MSSEVPSSPSKVSGLIQKVKNVVHKRDSSEADGKLGTNDTQTIAGIDPSASTEPPAYPGSGSHEPGMSPNLSDVSGLASSGTDVTGYGNAVSAHNNAANIGGASHPGKRQDSDATVTPSNTSGGRGTSSSPRTGNISSSSKHAPTGRLPEARKSKESLLDAQSALPSEFAAKYGPPEIKHGDPNSDHAQRHSSSVAQDLQKYGPGNV